MKLQQCREILQKQINDTENLCYEDAETKFINEIIIPMILDEPNHRYNNESDINKDNINIIFLSKKELAEEMFKDGMFGECDEFLIRYIDFEDMANSPWDSIFDNVYNFHEEFSKHLTVTYSN